MLPTKFREAPGLTGLNDEQALAEEKAESMIKSVAWVVIINAIFHKLPWFCFKIISGYETSTFQFTLPSFVRISS